MLSIVLVRIAGDDLPGKPIGWHVAEPVWIVQILIGERLYCLEKLRIHLLGFRKHLVQGAVAVFYEHCSVAFILRQVPKVRADERARLQYSQCLTLTPR